MLDRSRTIPAGTDCSTWRCSSAHPTPTSSARTPSPPPRTTYPDTLAAVVDALDWQGHPALQNTGTGAGSFEPSAVAWLHHTLRTTEADGASDVLTLIVPCTCGHGYTDIVLDTEEVLLEVLAELRPTHGLSLTRRPYAGLHQRSGGCPAGLLISRRHPSRHPYPGRRCGPPPH
ncbi:hypothetical protein O1Q96_22350 [Streptomyces sp. Qhu-G9]|uniref:hypothetical protein n=1 Tax=Streptomyces sp. Qhu-G9 TaxID=3452799 RepID=UPI0022AC7D7D|nr:hypothetical protein [Streptomyces aurantiacus]WAU82256.1 hypothetical protein O1Q96_22350 [Streptomyces aurantiacus]